MYFNLELDIPNQISTETIVSYNAPVSCDIASRASQFLKVKLESSIQCAQNKTCTVAVDAKGILSAKLESLKNSNEVTDMLTFWFFKFFFCFFLNILLSIYFNSHHYSKLVLFLEKILKINHFFLRLQHPF